MAQRLRVALAGYGMAGRGIHRPQLVAAGFEIAAISTSSPARIEQARSDEPAAQIVPDLDALLEVPDLDLVVLATPSGSHANHLTAAVAAGVATVVDKPITVDAPSARKAVDAAAQAATPLTVFQNRRWDPPHLAARKLLDEGRLGDLVRYEFRWERWRPEPKQRWREQATAAGGGGLLLDLGTHLVDSAVDLFGPVRSVFATVQAHTTVAEDAAVLVCRHAGGAVSELSTTSLAGAPGPRLRVTGTRGTFLVTEFESEPNGFPGFSAEPGCVGWLVRGDDRTPVPTVRAERTFYEQVAIALRSNDIQAALPVDPWDAVHTAEVIDAARASARSWQAVDISACG